MKSEGSRCLIQRSILKRQAEIVQRSLSCHSTMNLDQLRGVLFAARAGNDLIKADFMYTKRTTFPTKMKIGIHLEELK